ncbi:tautomerase family protein [Noviherbaspirillum pedocola]|uniref:Tautomerase family protein n=1 Tax=Noviherbaspirillum pedocola TaxID=2801341 RepID=A0A934WAC3_9BURK|nr:tautomerase family protein [Noviherbaspirillum pedocola]MBK4738519.1 tautomerase family protein [Noviherbaspirillum pedocola]
MPHIIVKIVSGKSEQQKCSLSQAITKRVTNILGYGKDAASVAFEEVAAKDWMDQVFEPEIQGKQKTLYKKPGYDSL